jgi:hypothetical protein
MVSERASQQAFFWRLGAALRCQRGGNDRLVRVHVGDGRDADARWLDDVDGVDADARTHVDSRRRDGGHRLDLRPRQAQAVVPEPLIPGMASGGSALLCSR